ncbi:hypothetical protein A1O7_04369 [Cladophialophora yegresii CBS 114405]|uniref:Uncharacterized protein n=1 Tax=Cladophialophora yegresii CBS 114405 TaxID=1182544 RepID=W9VWK3_9EURO|nr:uncharacterized protein A1O7_04369 [Cladophialophora yegresii CBS 114405]EXJ60217.1 hypothetical protein A1O7_04369 [Cladophialophora yegresii CBS 114405]
MESEPTLHPHLLPDTHHRKIELQSTQDLTYLQSNLIASARQKLDLHFPPSATQQQQPKKAQPATVISLDGVNPTAQDSHSQPTTQQRQQVSSNAGEIEDREEDPMRAAVRAYVDAFISRIYTSASHSLTVNGLDVTSLPPTSLTTKHPAPVSASSDARGSSSGAKEEKEGVDFIYEGHDTRLQQKVADMYAELESLTVQVGQLRREAPRHGAEAFGRLCSETMEGEGEAFEKVIAALKQEATESGSDDRVGDVLKLNPLPEGWFEDRRTMYERGTNQLAAFAGLAGQRGDGSRTGSAVKGPSLTETVGRVQRARTVAMEFE